MGVTSDTSGPRQAWRQTWQRTRRTWRYRTGVTWSITPRLNWLFLSSQAKVGMSGHRLCWRQRCHSSGFFCEKINWDLFTSPSFDNVEAVQFLWCHANLASICSCKSGFVAIVSNETSVWHWPGRLLFRVFPPPQWLSSSSSSSSSFSYA